MFARTLAAVTAVTSCVLSLTGVASADPAPPSTTTTLFAMPNLGTRRCPANSVFIRSIDQLRHAGVRVLFGPGEFEPHPPRTGGRVLDDYPWQRALDTVRT